MSMKIKEFSLHSPKNKFRCEINLNNALEGIGSVTSFNANTIKGIMGGIEQRSGTIQRAKGASIVILENRKTYPEFEWEIIERIKK